ncbi:protein PTST homolog 2, chloroplastic-like isoform X1 [Primulina tabacum]|uniref:protein PTST homolog 2, chloroplastic-like isoform X1 n=1 Tax=Primulina tabacum TaxID=48773 RepID=UPI003F5AB90F
MVLLISSHSRILISHNTFSRLNYSLTPFLISRRNPKNWPQICKLTAVPGAHSFGFVKARRDKNFGGYLDESWCCLCMQSEGDLELEAEIMEFMKKSEKPTMFPTRDELARAGRMDLVESIKKMGGWYTLGWDEENVEKDMDFDIGEFQRRVERIGESVSMGEQDNCSWSGNDKEDVFSSSSDSNSENLNSALLTSSSPSGRSLEMNAAADTGIEGLLNRLEKQRSSNFGVDLEQFGYGTHATSKDEANNNYFGTSFDVARVDNGENGRHPTGLRHQGIYKPVDKMSSNSEPETWRNWSNQRAGFHYSEFEAAEISFEKDIVEHGRETYRDTLTAINGESGEAWDVSEEINLNHIKSRIQHLELELSTALRSLRSKRENMTEEVDGISVSDFQKLSDEREFQENEFMSTQERLRSMRAKMAILEGKMAMAITDAQKIVEKKQEQIYRAHKAIQHLRDTCIVWHNSASEVLLTGSFDGWTTQRKMEKSETGIFSVSLMLYPGRYEIKFIVDGIWKVDPLRPIVNSSGYQNNLLIVT